MITKITIIITIKYLMNMEAMVARGLEPCDLTREHQLSVLLLLQPECLIWVI